MAKRRSRSKKKYTAQRDNRNISKRSTLLRRPLMMEVQDGRKFKPVHIFYSRKISGRDSQVAATIRGKSGTKKIPLSRSIIGYTDPRNTIVCKRRSDRRKTLFAKNKIGKGKGSRNKKRRYTENSKVRC